MSNYINILYTYNILWTKGMTTRSPPRAPKFLVYWPMGNGQLPLSS